MPISQTEQVHLTCPACGAGFEADVWTLVDAAERPDLSQALRDDALDVVVCPSCKQGMAAGAPLLFHEPAGRRVYFAVPPGADEHAWRERAQQLLYALVAAIPEEQRLPYLGDVQVEHEVAGVRRALLRRERRHARGAEARRQVDRGTEANVARSVTAVPVVPVAAAPASAPDESLIEAVRALLAADTEAEFAAIVAANPELRGPAGDDAIRQLADLAYGQGHPDIAAALREVRSALGRMRVGQPPMIGASSDSPPSRQTADSALLPDRAEHSEPKAQSVALSDSAYQALLQVGSQDELVAAARDYPALLDAWADEDLAARIDAALEEGNERLARAIETRSEELSELRARLGAPDALAKAVDAVMAAGGEDALADTLAQYPILLGEAAQRALAGVSAGARARGDQQAAALAEERSALLRTVRAGLEER